MGVAPSEEIFELIEVRAMSIKGVLGLNDVRAHMLGTKIECEIHIYVDQKLNIKKAHDIGKRVQFAIEAMDDVQRAYVHIDPFLGRKHKPRRF
jgi:divalent metal cation (Fe/Co/Zn/Cd) transporter